MVESYKGYDIKPIPAGKRWRVLILKSGGGVDWQNTLEADSEAGVMTLAKALLDSGKPTH